MGTLTDITAQANNVIKRRSNSAMGYQALNSPDEKENVTKSKSPHFMTPTFSSKQSVVANEKSQDRVETPVPSKPIKADGNNAWMKSAAKRVGIHRASDGTPRLKKVISSKQTKAISFPDKVRSYVLNLSHFFVELDFDVLACYTFLLQDDRHSTIDSTEKGVAARQTTSDSSHCSDCYLKPSQSIQLSSRCN